MDVSSATWPLVLWSLPLGAGLDALLGDPRGWPHPVRAIGRLISAGERGARGILSRFGERPVLERAAGVAIAVGVISVTWLVAHAIVTGCDRLGEFASLAGRSLLIYWGLATRSLAVETLKASEASDLESARRELSWIVGRDTGSLDEPEICRACVETIAENANDAIVAPLFWFALGGPAALWAFKASSTLDSMLGYRNPRYLRLGWASARLDDLANLVPARLTWLLMAIASALVGERPWSALRIGWRDGRKHPSPNAAWGEAAMAGALGVQLGGTSTYGGIPSTKPFLGDRGPALDRRTVRRALRVMAVAAALAVVLAWFVRSFLLGLA